MFDQFLLLSLVAAGVFIVAVLLVGAFGEFPRAAWVRTVFLLSILWTVVFGLYKLVTMSASVDPVVEERRP